MHETLEGAMQSAWMRWLTKYLERCGAESVAPAATIALMRQVNPQYIPRNHLLQQV